MVLLHQAVPVQFCAHAGRPVVAPVLLPAAVAASAPLVLPAPHPIGKLPAAPGGAAAPLVALAVPAPAGGPQAVPLAGTAPHVAPGVVAVPLAGAAPQVAPAVLVVPLAGTAPQAAQGAVVVPMAGTAPQVTPGSVVVPIVGTAPQVAPGSVVVPMAGTAPHVAPGVVVVPAAGTAPQGLSATLGPGHLQKQGSPPPRPLTATLGHVPVADSSTVAPQSAAASAKSLGPAAAPPPGGSIHIGGRTFRRLRELGRGTFGVVWEVRPQDSAAGAETPAGSDAATSDGGSDDAPPTLLALKWSTPARREMLEACLLEAEVLQQLAGHLPEGSDASQRVPRHVAHGIVSSAVVGPMGPGAPGLNHVLLAMSKLEGKPVDQWLYGVDEQVLKTIPLDRLLNGPLDGGRLASRDLKGASDTAAALLAQLAPVFAALEGIAVHRDLSAHNFLVRPGTDGQQVEQFAVLDFGLAVRARNWRLEWQSRNIAGDPRYFAPAAWMLLAFGHKYIEAHPDPQFRRQYRDRIDHFAVGVLSAEILFALWDCPSAAPAGDEAHLRALAQARAAWQEYWREAMLLFQRFHAEGASSVRQMITGSQVMLQLVNKLRALCLALRAAADHQFPAADNVAPLLRITAGLLDWRSSWPSWRDVSGLLSSAKSPPQDLSAAAHAAGGSAGPPASGGLAVASPRTPHRTCPHSHRRASTQQEEVPAARPVVAPIEIPKEEPGQKAARALASPGASMVRTPTTPQRLEGAARMQEEADAGSEPAVLTPTSQTRFQAAALAGAGAASSPTKRGAARPGWPKLTHRRVWTVDEAVSLGRGVPQVEAEQQLLEIIQAGNLLRQD